VEQGGHPGAKRTWNGGWQEPVAGNEIDPVLAKPVDRRGARSAALAFDRDHRVPVPAANRRDQDRNLAANARRLRFQHFQGEAGGNPGVDGVTPLLEDPEAGGRRQVVAGRDDSVGADDNRSRGEARHRFLRILGVMIRIISRQIPPMAVRICDNASHWRWAGSARPGGAPGRSRDGEAEAPLGFPLPLGREC
jgi:hypothetical protein